jgi:hypothetical protein
MFGIILISGLSNLYFHFVSLHLRQNCKKQTNTNEIRVSESRVMCATLDFLCFVPLCK